MAGWQAAALTNPMDVVKTRLMLQQAGRQEGALAVLARVAASEGWRGLAAGLLPRLLWVSSSVGDSCRIGRVRDAGTKKN